MLSIKNIKELVSEYGQRVNEGRSIKEIIKDGDIPKLRGSTIQEGKVSDSVYSSTLSVTPEHIPLRLMFRSNRISTHDKKRGRIPFKDQVLAVNHDYMLRLVRSVLGTSQFDVPDLKATSTVIPSENLDLIQFENVIRAFMAETSTSTSLYMHWKDAKDKGKVSFEFSGRTYTTAELSPNCKLPEIIDTPSTKDAADLTINPLYLINNGICTAQDYESIIQRSYQAFQIISDHLMKKGIILVDTKTEHGVNSEGNIVVADEVYTMDSSRFWLANLNGSVKTRNGRPISFSKEFARGMVQGEQGFTSDQANKIAVRYIDGLQRITGEEFVPDLRPRDERIIESTNMILEYLL